MKTKFTMQNQPIKFLILAVAILLGLSSPAMAQGTLTWSWTWTGTNYTGSGTFETTNVTSSGYNGFIGYLGDSASGTFNGQAITLDSVGSLGGFGENLVSGGSPQLSYSGIVFSSPTNRYNIYFNSTDYYVTNHNLIADNYSFDIGTFTAQVIPVPEPATAALLMQIAAASCVLLARRKRRAV